MVAGLLCAAPYSTTRRYPQLRMVQLSPTNPDGVNLEYRSHAEPEAYVPLKNHLNRKIATGTFALQGHDPKSKVFFKDIKVRILPD